MRRILDIISIVVIATLATISLNLYLNMLDQRAVDKMPLDRLVCDDVELEFIVGESYQYLGGCRFAHTKTKNPDD